MELNKLLEGIAHFKESNFNPNVTFLTCNSKEVKEGSVFAALKGVNFDGHNFVKKALECGACAVLVEKDFNIKNQIIVRNSHKAYSKMCANFLDNPAKNLKFIGVTGTNGKTTVTNIIKNILSREGKKVGLIGTIQNEICSEVIPTEKTTPNPMDFQMLIKNMLDKNCEYVVMEVSSHALAQHRIADTQFEIAIFTNLSQDHLDYHKTMQNYFDAKKMLFEVAKKGIVFIDDEYGKKLINSTPCEIYTFSVKNNEADFLAQNIKLTSNYVQYNITGEDINTEIIFNTPGLFSVYNSMAAFICCKMLGLNDVEIAKNIKHCEPIKGRSEVIKTYEDFNIICDYAHSPDSLKNILASIKSYKKGRIITLFGCGGDRDRKKRPIMGEIAAKNSDFLIVTSDNPRTEPPIKIIEDILIGVRKTDTPYVKILNRKKAIEYAIKNAKKNDTILLAGKGHETYQIIGTTKIKLDEREIVYKALAELKQEKNLKRNIQEDIKNYKI